MGAQTLKNAILQLQDYENYTLHLTYPAKKSLYDDRTEQVTKTLNAAQALTPCGSRWTLCGDSRTLTGRCRWLRQIMSSSETPEDLRFPCAPAQIRKKEVDCI